MRRLLAEPSSMFIAAIGLKSGPPTEENAVSTQYDLSAMFSSLTGTGAGVESFASSSSRSSDATIVSIVDRNLASMVSSSFCAKISDSTTLTTTP